MSKTQDLSLIAEAIRACISCKVNKIGKAVPGEGCSSADIVFVGEAPGKTEAVTGRPFVGRSGKLLRMLIREIGLQDEEVYITSPVKYLPKRGTPIADDIAHGKTHLDKQLEIIDPKLVVLLGSVAVQGVLGEKRPVLKEHGTIVEKENKRYFITLHPSAALRFVKFKKILKDDFLKIREII